MSCLQTAQLLEAEASKTSLKVNMENQLLTARSTSSDKMKEFVKLKGSHDQVVVKIVNK